MQPGVQYNSWKKKYMALLFLVFLLGNPSVLLGAQAAWNNINTVSIRRFYQQWPALETAYFHLRYAPENEELAIWLGREADLAVVQVKERLPHDSRDKKPWLVLVPDQETLRRAFGWNDGTGALGVYLSDTIKILSPEAWSWVKEHKRLDTFQKQGPLVHEYTHYVLDLRTGGNYTRWFSEGLAQLTEYDVLGYEWLEAGSSLSNPLYSPDELDRLFDALPDQALAYRQALSMVTFLESREGFAGLNQFIDELGQGVSFYKALEQIYGMNRTDFFSQWEQWYPQNARWFMMR